MNETMLAAVLYGKEHVQVQRVPVPDIGPEDLLRTLVGLCYMHNTPSWQANVLRLVDVLVDGLRRNAGPPPTSMPT